MLVRSWRRNR